MVTVAVPAYSGAEYVSALKANCWVWVALLTLKVTDPIELQVRGS
jgi:hypothetical protein